MSAPIAAKLVGGAAAQVAVASQGGYQLLAPMRVNLGGHSATTLGGGTVQTTRIRVDPLFSTSRVRLRFSNYIPGSSGVGEQPGWFPLRHHVFLEYLPANGDVTAETGLRVPVTFRGDRYFSADGLGSLEVEADFNAVAGIPFFIRVARYAPSTGIITPYGYTTLGGTGEGGLNNGEGVSLADATEVGTVTQSVAAGYGPVAVLGLAKTLVPSAGIFGDSIPTGTGDAGFAIGNGANTVADGGWLVRGLSGQTTLVPVIAPAGPKAPIVRGSTGGEMLSAAIDGRGPQYGSPVRRANLALASTIFCTFGINDLSNGVSLATLQALALQDAAYWLAQGKKYVRATLFPLTSSSNGWIDVAGQFFANAQRETDRKGFCAWVRDTGPTGFMAQALAMPGVPVGAKVAIVDPAAAVEVNSAGVLTPNGGYWMPAVNGGAALVAGTFTAGTTTASYSDSSKSWTQDQWRGYLVRFTSGAAANTLRTIATNNTNRLRVVIPAGGAAPEPASGDTYQIIQGYTEDGVHPSSFGHMTAALATNPVSLVA